ncbi:MAG TPA: zinc ribbon domain-containing protein [bacterium]|nr:zinc ribbon domain-containing protein [bacterium]
MPIYEYRCTQCGHAFEAFQRMGADGQDLTCPKCQAPKPEKIFSSFAASSAAGGLNAGGASLSGCGGSTGFS